MCSNFKMSLQLFKTTIWPYCIELKRLYSSSSTSSFSVSFAVPWLEFLGLFGMYSPLTNVPFCGFRQWSGGSMNLLSVYINLIWWGKGFSSSPSWSDPKSDSSSWKGALIANSGPGSYGCILFLKDGIWDSWVGLWVIWQILKNFAGSFHQA